MKQAELTREQKDRVHLLIGRDNVGYKIIAYKRASTHENDAHLYIVFGVDLKFSSGMQYVVWTYNAESDGFGGGAYFLEFENAAARYNERGVRK